jgi:hypothetical protein
MEMTVKLWIIHESQPSIFYGVDYIAQGPTMFQIMWIDGGHFAIEHCKIQSFAIEKGQS